MHPARRRCSAQTLLRAEHRDIASDSRPPTFIFSVKIWIETAAAIPHRFRANPVLETRLREPPVHSLPIHRTTIRPLRRPHLPQSHNLATRRTRSGGEALAWSLPMPVQNVEKRGQRCVYFVRLSRSSIRLFICANCFVCCADISVLALQCDGQRPCGRCKAQKDVDCVYEIPVRQSKENLRTEIESLRVRQRSSDQVFAALVRPDLWEEVLRRLRGGQSVENISDWLGTALSSDISGDHVIGPASGSGFGAGPSRGIGQLSLGVDTGATQQPGIRGDVQQNSPWTISQAGSTRSNSYTDAMNWTSDNAPGPPQTRVGSWAEPMPPDHMSDSTMPRYRGLEQILSFMDESEVKTPPQSWTSITGDINLVQHLLALYFCWEYPTFASLSKEHFLQDFQDGRQRYCSPILINALLALGCRFSTHPMTRANPNDPYSSGDHFFKESQRLFNQETDHHSLTTIQALGIMSIREASCGRDSESWYYAGQSIRLAVEMGLHRIQDGLDEDELAVQAATFWGAFALDQ